MIPRGSLHNHTLFSDGADTMEDMVLAAIRLGFTVLAVTDHAWAPYDRDCCMPRESVADYFAQGKRLARQYADRIRVLVGLESDYYHPAPPQGQQITVGSVHYVRDPATMEYICVDHRHDLFQKAAQRAGGIRPLLAQYFDLVADMALRQRPDIIGHMDLVAKLNGDGRYFDENSDWYLQITGDAVRCIAGTGCIVEVNTGGMARGYRDTPYPAPPILAQLLEAGVPVTITSDAHEAAALDYGFDEAAALLRRVGYRCVKQWGNDSFVDVEL